MRYAQILILLLWTAAWGSRAMGQLSGLHYNDVEYLSLKDLAKLLSGDLRFGQVERPLGIQPLELVLRGKQWDFMDGGRTTGVKGNPHKLTLRHPLLVTSDDYFAPIDELSDAMSLRFERADSLSMTDDTNRWPIKMRALDAPRHRIDTLKVVHEAVVLNRAVECQIRLEAGAATKSLSEGTTLLIRRSAQIDGERMLIVTDLGPDLQSYLVAEDLLRANASHFSGFHTTHFAKVLHRLNDDADHETALCHGDREKRKQSVALTVDLCWSLRPLEPTLLPLLRSRAEKLGAPVHVTFFLSGHWMLQHPEEMQQLIEFGKSQGIAVTWGLHSFEHPKYGEFLNGYGVDQLRADTLLLEAEFLRWGLVPTVFYRFPGLVHDHTRLQTILDMDLLPVDCDSWMVLVQRNAGPPFGGPIQDGSIILVHGNGNEPAGIPLLQEWLDGHGRWQLQALWQFTTAPNGMHETQSR